MKKCPRISPAEWQVMKVIWAGSPILARDVIARLASGENWHPKTIRTLLARLVKKGAVGFKQQGRAYMYRPLIKETEGVRAESQVFLDRVFGGNVVAMLSHYIEGREFSESELGEMRGLLGGE